MTDEIEMKFGWENVRPVYEGAFQLTARYNWDEPIESGDTLILTDPEGVPFALARVEIISHMTLFTFYEMDYAHHRSYRTLDDCIDAFKNYYPESEHEMGRETPLTVIHFDVFDLLDYDWGRLDDGSGTPPIDSEEVGDGD